MTNTKYGKFSMWQISASAGNVRTCGDTWRLDLQRKFGTRIKRFFLTKKINAKQGTVMNSKKQNFYKSFCKIGISGIQRRKYYLQIE
jgi:hypothetical protein